MRKYWAFLALAFLASFSAAAFVYGDIYSKDLTSLNKTVIRIDGPFTYQLVTGKPNYSIYLPEGEFKITAESATDGGLGPLSAKETVVIGKTDQRIDLVLSPDDTISVYFPFIVLATVALAIGMIWLWSNSRKMPPPPVPDDAKEAGTGTTSEPPVPPASSAPVELDEAALTVLRAIDGFEGRCTQQELKDALGYSDAKLSLILTELEAVGRIKKFKRGRGNIIRKISGPTA